MFILAAMVEIMFAMIVMMLVLFIGGRVVEVFVDSITALTSRVARFFPPAR